MSRIFTLMLVAGIFMGLAITANVLSQTEEKEQELQVLDASFMEIYKTVDVNLAAKINEQKIEDPDLNKATSFLAKGAKEIIFGGLYIGKYIAKTNPQLYSLLALPIVILFFFYATGIPIITLTGAIIYLAYEQIKKRRNKT